MSLRPEPRRPSLNQQIGDRLIRPILFALLTTGAAAALAAWMFHDLGFVQVAGVLLGAVLLVSTIYGVGAGLLSAMLGALAFNSLIGSAAISSQVQTPVDVILLAVLIASSCVAGVLSDISRRRPSLLSGAGEDLPASGLSGLAMVKLEASESARSLKHDLLRLAGTGLGVCAGLVALLMMQPSVRGGSPALVLAAAVVGLAALHGARFGALSGMVAAISLHVLSSDAGAANAYWAMALLDMGLLVALGWGVGRFSDQVARERRALKTMTRASREFWAARDESAVWSILFEAVVSLSPQASLRLVDESGAVLHEVERPDVGRWRSRRLSSDGRDFGAVFWAIPSTGLESLGRDELMASIVDLGASAVARTRLGVEKAEMEFIARTEQLRTILLDAVSHHFRTPLAGIIGSVTSVLNLPEPHDRAARRDLLLIIKEQANRLHRYVENFLSVARLESGAIEMRLEEIAVEPLLYDVWESFGEAGGARRFLHVKVDSGLVRADSALLQQVFGNVLENAIKFSSEGSVVDVRTRRVEDKLVFDITDQGCGVTPPNETRIFERFFRSRGAIAPGLGLGLYITRSLVELQGGVVEAHNRDDGETGLVVSIALPLAEAA